MLFHYNHWEHKNPDQLHLRKNRLPKLNLFLFICVFFALAACRNEPKGTAEEAGRDALIEPDYSGVTIPPNIAPLNFIIKEPGTSYFVKIYGPSVPELKISTDDGKIIFPVSEWTEFLKNNIGKDFKMDIYTQDKLGKWTKFRSYTNNVYHLAETHRRSCVGIAFIKNRNYRLIGFNENAMKYDLKAFLPRSG